MKFEEFEEYIWVPKTPHFDIKETLECGQVFRYKVQDFGYTVYSSDQKADIYCQEGGTKIFTNNKKYFINYFDFYTNYAKIKSSLEASPILNGAIEYGKGIRILNADPVEMIVEFIISQNNNIPRIKAIVEKICENYGENKGDYFAFPKLERLKAIPLEFFKSIKCGYRDMYLFESIKSLNIELIDSLRIMSTADARAELMKLRGVGRKVADCILLFGFHKTDVFPTDTWIIKAYNSIYRTSESDARKISEYFTSMFGEYSGFAQQYLFYKMRDSKIGEKL